ncbi:hypothetical protein Purlil1_8441 [Purpureocillium lilacinum]|uniref:Uncharacterized protein n=1 Tax=Purpureocillium lilacinum TaxID=33203 RepID=A0ABR0BTY8_PURLI|nr:hypothetical protein Purlil1_8441 [Purpureocillium lilacinum]
MHLQFVFAAVLVAGAGAAESVQDVKCIRCQARGGVNTEAILGDLKRGMKDDDKFGNYEPMFCDKEAKGKGVVECAFMSDLKMMKQGFITGKEVKELADLFLTKNKEKKCHNRCMKIDWHKNGQKVGVFSLDSGNTDCLGKCY